MADTGKQAAADNPFAQAMEQASRSAEEFTRMFADLKLPAMPGMDVWMGAYKRNIEAMTAANRIALEGAQAVARRQADIMQQAMAEMSETMRAMSSPEPPPVKAARQAEMLKQAHSRAVANLRELSDLIRRSNAEALELLNKRFADALDEVQHAMDHAAGPAKK